MSCHDLHLRRCGMLAMLALLVLAAPVSAASIYAGKLNFRTTEDDLRAVFEEFGKVSSVRIMIDPQTKRSKGFGFVEMPNAEEAQAAIHSLNEKELDGRVIVVKLAGPGEASGPSRPAAGGGRPASQPPPPAKPAAPPVAPSAPTPPTPAPEPVIAPTQPTPPVAVADNAGDEAPDAESKATEGTPDPADEPEISGGDDEDDVIDEEEEAEDDGAMADQESGEDTTDEAAEVSEGETGESSGADDAMDIEAADEIENDQFEDSAESDAPDDTAEPADDDAVQ